LNFIGIIPARYESSRFPGKPLCDIGGKPMVCKVHESASKWDKWSNIYVATDDHRIVEACNNHSVPALVTKKSHTDCLDRAAEAVELIEGMGDKADRYIIIQGDEPLFEAKTLDTDLSPEIVNFYTHVQKEEERDDPNAVKVIVSKYQKAMYFSRTTIPYDAEATRRSKDKLKIYKQIGVYSFSASAIKKYTHMSSSYYENLEGIGLLRLLENGVDVHMRYTKHDSVSVDTEKDRQRIVSLL
tara:strand:- start:7305 stop:8030 length:726 start_codon:yes stop_codon:yes gene_type:complete